MGRETWSQRRGNLVYVSYRRTGDWSDLVNNVDDLLWIVLGSGATATQITDGSGAGARRLFKTHVPESPADPDGSEKGLGREMTRPVKFGQTERMNCSRLDLAAASCLLLCHEHQRSDHDTHCGELMADLLNTRGQLQHDRSYDAIRVFIAVVGSLAYATLRYNVFKGVPWPQWPVYVVNKAFALGSLVLIVWILVRRRQGRSLHDDLWTWTTACMVAHVALSLAILTPAYYPKYFDGPTFTTAAGFSWLLGTIAAAWLFLRLRRCEPAAGRDNLWLGMIGLVAGVHAAVLGFAGWFTPATWPGHMVPITLISFVLGVTALILGVINRPNSEPLADLSDLSYRSSRF